MISSFKKGSHTRHVAVLVAGTTAAQILPIAASPILTRLYTPEDFGLLAVFGSVTTILMSVSTSQYESAITLPSTDKDAASIVSLCVRICTFFSIFLMLVVLIFNQQLAFWIGHPEIAIWLYLIPIVVYSAGLYKTYTFWCNRRSAYGSMAKQTFQLSAVTVVASISLGVISIAGGQIVGVLIGRITSAVSIFRTVHKVDKDVLSDATNRPVRPIAIRYKAHPTYFMPSRLINEIALQLPIFMISSLFVISAVGFFSIAYRLVTLPTSLVANAIGNVYRQRISESYNQHGEFRDIYKRTLLTTFLIAVVPFTALYFIAPFLFAFAFGDEWRVAGVYAQILVVSTFFSFIVTPMNTGAIVVGAKRYYLAWNIGRFFCYAGLWFMAHTFALSIEVLLWLFVAINVCLYVIDACYQYKLSGGAATCNKALP